MDENLGLIFDFDYFSEKCLLLIVDGAVDWEEYILMYYRNITDETCLEPSSLFTIVQFLMYDQQFRGVITEEDTMMSLFAR